MDRTKRPKAAAAAARLAAIRDGSFTIEARPNVRRANEILAAQAKRPPVCYVVIAGPIDAAMTDHVRAALQANPYAETLHLTVNSRGGLIDEGVTIAQMLMEHPAKKKIGSVHRLCASAAMLPFLAMDVRHAGKDAKFLMHPASVGNEWTESWNADKLERTARFLRGADLSDADFIMARTGMHRAAIAADLKHERKMGAMQALSYGVVHSIRDVEPLMPKNWRQRVAEGMRANPKITMGFGMHRLREGYLKACELVGR